MRLIFLLIALVCQLAASAQKEVLLHLKSGEVITYGNAEIDSITFGTRLHDDDYRGHEYVDLGLPSGLKWATCNVGAELPEENGNYYRWAETKSIVESEATDHKYFVGFKLTKYNLNEKLGVVDNKIVLDPEDDAAHVAWGGKWRMPTHEEMTELITYCSKEKYTINSVTGYKYTGPNGNSIFLPYSGVYFSGGSSATPTNYGQGLYYWSSSLNDEPSLGSSNYGEYECNYAFYLDKTSISKTFRRFGLPVRAVTE